MVARLGSVLVAFALVGLGTAAFGQEVIVYRPVAPVVQPVLAPTVTYGPVVVQRPVIVSSQPVTVYRSYVPAAPVTVYSPVVSAPAVVAPQPVVVARPVIVRPKVYVPGQPIRNVLRAVTP